MELTKDQLDTLVWGAHDQDREVASAEKRLREAIGWADSKLASAIRDLDRDFAPNSLGILQSGGPEVDRLAGEYAHIREHRERVLYMIGNLITDGRAHAMGMKTRHIQPVLEGLRQVMDDGDGGHGTVNGADVDLVLKEVLAG